MGGNMPELPEVETIVCGLKSKLLGKVISQVEIYKPLVLKTPLKTFLSGLQGGRIQSISRHGKSIFWSLDNGKVVKLHLGMSGALFFRKGNSPPDPYVRLRFKLKGCGEELVFRDVRQFGRISLVNDSHEPHWGPDAWNASVSDLFRALRKKKGMIKHALLNQGVLAGLGNIYVDETLFQARIHPKKKLERLSDSVLQQLCFDIRAVLAKAIESGGTTFRDYVNAEGKKGNFLLHLKVYGRDGQPCSVCGGLIQFGVVASRGTHYCPQCQKQSGQCRI